MKKVVLVFGLIGGGIIVALMFLTMPFVDMADPEKMEMGKVIGYSTMIIALSTIFFGIKTYRDKYNGGVVKFGKGFLVGLYITLIATAMYAIGWEGFMVATGSSPQKFADQYMTSQVKILEDAGATAEAIKAKTDEINSMMKYYTNPLFRFFITMSEMLPVGLLVSLISAAILRRKNVLPANA